MENMHEAILLLMVFFRTVLYVIWVVSYKLVAFYEMPFFLQSVTDKLWLLAAIFSKIEGAY